MTWEIVSRHILRQTIGTLRLSKQQQIHYIYLSFPGYLINYASHARNAWHVCHIRHVRHACHACESYMSRKTCMLLSGLYCFLLCISLQSVFDWLCNDYFMKIFILAWLMLHVLPIFRCIVFNCTFLLSLQIDLC